MEAALPAALAARHDPHFDPGAFRIDRWQRQYVGLVRHGRRYIHGNYLPGPFDTVGKDRWRREPIVVCDSGPSFFGAEYDVRGRTITHIAFNGFA